MTVVILYGPIYKEQLVKGQRGELYTVLAVSTQPLLMLMPNVLGLQLNEKGKADVVRRGFVAKFGGKAPQPLWCKALRRSLEGRIVYSVGCVKDFLNRVRSAPSNVSPNIDLCCTYCLAV